MVGAAADLASKAVAPRIGLTTFQNPDLSLGLVRLDGPIWLVASVTIAACITLPHSIQLWRQRRFSTFGLAALIGGAAGNAIDRIDDGSVTDWLPVGPIALNLADVLVWLGLGLYLLVALSSADRWRPTEPHRDRRAGERGNHETPTVQVGAGRQRRGDGHRHHGTGQLRPLTESGSSGN